MADDLLYQSLIDACLLSGTFKLRSGGTSDRYFDKYRFEARPDLLAKVAELMLPLIPEGTDVLAGLEMGGIPVATALSLQSRLPAAFVRKKAKDYGTCNLAEGAAIEGKRLTIIEDVVTTGGQVLKSTAALRDRGAIVDHALCVLLRDESAIQNFKAEGLTLTPLFVMDQ